MKQIFFLFVFFSSFVVTAQAEYEAATFQLKGPVKRCEVRTAPLDEGIDTSRIDKELLKFKLLPEHVYSFHQSGLILSDSSWQDDYFYEVRYSYNRNNEPLLIEHKRNDTLRMYQWFAYDGSGLLVKKRESTMTRYRWSEEDFWQHVFYDYFYVDGVLTASYDIADSIGGDTTLITQYYSYESNGLRVDSTSRGWRKSDVYKYSTDSLLLEHIFYPYSSRLSGSRNTYTYDDQKRLITRIDSTYDYDKDGNVITSEWSYEPTASVCKKTWKMTSGKVYRYEISHYDQHGNLTKIVTSDGKNKRTTISHAYRYDAYDNWLYDLTYMNGKLSSVTWRKIEYYKE